MKDTVPDSSVADQPYLTPDVLDGGCWQSGQMIVGAFTTMRWSVFCCAFWKARVGTYCTDSFGRGGRVVGGGVVVGVVVAGGVVGMVSSGSGSGIGIETVTGSQGPVHVRSGTHTSTRRSCRQFLLFSVLTHSAASAQCPSSARPFVAKVITDWSTEG